MERSDAAANVSQAEFARLRNVSRKTTTLWKQKGWLVLNDAGQVDVAATDKLLAQRPATYRGGEAAQSDPVTPAVTPSAVTQTVTPETGGSKKGKAKAKDAATPEPMLLDERGAAIPSMANAVRLKEHYLALQRKHEHEIRNQEWVRVEAVGVEVEKDYAVVRELLLTIPGKIASSLVGADRAKIEAVIREAITEALHELHDPDGIAGRAIAPE